MLEQNKAFNMFCNEILSMIWNYEEKIAELNKLLAGANKINIDFENDETLTKEAVEQAYNNYLKRTMNIDSKNITKNS